MSTSNDISYLNCRIKELEKALTAYSGGNREAGDEIVELHPDPVAWGNRQITHRMKEYRATGKWGNRVRDGLMGLEYEAADSSRVWVYRDRTVEED